MKIESWPICAICDKPVDTVERYTELHTLHEVFTVRCHGQRETIKLKHWDIKNADRIEMTKAFDKAERNMN